MRALALECPARFFVTSFSLMNITETDESERCRQPMSSSSTHVVAPNRQLAHGYSIYYFFSHISCPLLHNLVDFKLTGLWSLVKLLFWAQRSGKIIWLIPWSTMHLMPKTHVNLPLAPFLTKASLRLSRVFPSYIYSAPSLFFFISLWLIFKRETVAFDSVNLAFTPVTLSVVSLQAFLQRITLTVSFYFFFTLFTCS